MCVPWTERALGLCATREVDSQMSIAELFLSGLKEPGICYCCCCTDPSVTDLGGGDVLCDVRCHWV